MFHAWQWHENKENNHACVNGIEQKNKPTNNHACMHEQRWNPHELTTIHACMNGMKKHMNHNHANMKSTWTTTTVHACMNCMKDMNGMHACKKHMNNMNNMNTMDGMHDGMNAFFLVMNTWSCMHACMHACMYVWSMHVILKSKHVLINVHDLDTRASTKHRLST